MRVVHVRRLPGISDSMLSPPLSDLSYPNSIDISYGKLVLVTTYDQYISAIVREDIDVVLIGEREEELSRLKLISELVENGKLSSEKKNWLFGISNPAEIGLYPKMFSGYINSRIEVVVCEVAYLYAVYGAMFSRVKGVLSTIVGNNSLPVALDREQMRVFYYNSGIVSEFIDGDISEEYLGRANVILSEGVF